MVHDLLRTYFWEGMLEGLVDLPLVSVVGFDGQKHKQLAIRLEMFAR